MSKKCENCGNEHIEVITKEIGYSCPNCGRNTVRMEELHKTNADRIQSMSIEELAEFLSAVKYDGIYYHEGQEYPMQAAVWREWLQEENEE